MVNKYLINSYKETLDYLYTRLPMFQRTGPAAYKSSLENTWRLDEMYHSPHCHFPTIHVAGTNGKGSVSHSLASILQSAGYRTGLYTSPHLKDFRERIRIDGKMIPQTEVTRWVNQFLEKNREYRIEPSFFELTVAMAFDYFERSKVDIAVIEVGLGGRLDSTNIITPRVSIITNISYDHQSLLGNTLVEIAREKAGIIKPGIPVVISQYQPIVAEVFLRKAEEMKAPLWFAGREFTSGEGVIDRDGRQVFDYQQNGKMRFPDLKIDLLGTYQRLNIPAMLKAVEVLVSEGWKIPDEAVYKGLAHVIWQTGLQGRWQIIGHHPLTICDTGHNEDGIRQVAEQLGKLPCHNLHIVFGVVADKDSNKMLDLLPQNARYYFTKANLPRALDENILRERAKMHGLEGPAFPAVKEAFNAAREAAEEDDVIFVGGSNFVVAEIL